MKTRRVRILVAITDDGYYMADGSAETKPGDLIAQMQETVQNVMQPPVEFYWIEADVPVPAAPKPPVIEAESVRNAR